ncbi:Phosphatidylinositol transfer protein [Trinorchestia longiramus]|nr:Phosphatidylinositol transfer protein [Trinorchestia longiramus]
MLKEYRVCMPFTMEEYKIGQLYMIARHSAEQSDEKGEGVETIVNEPCEDEEHGKGQYTEKRIHLTSKLPTWIRSYIPRFIYVTEKSWNYYPYTVTEYTMHAGTCPEEKAVVDFVDIVTDPVRPHQYKESEDPCKFKSKKTGRGPLESGWRETTHPIMTSYKLVQISFPLFGLQTRVEDYLHKEVRNVNVLSHRQAFTWMDEWHGWTIEDVRRYETKMQEATNEKIRKALKQQNADKCEVDLDEEGNVKVVPLNSASAASTPSSGSATPASSDSSQKQGSYFSSFFKWS